MLSEPSKMRNSTEAASVFGPSSQATVAASLPPGKQMRRSRSDDSEPSMRSCGLPLAVTTKDPVDCKFREPRISPPGPQISRFPSAGSPGDPPICVGRSSMLGSCTLWLLKTRRQRVSLGPFTIDTRICWSEVGSTRLKLPHSEFITSVSRETTKSFSPAAPDGTPRCERCPPAESARDFTEPTDCLDMTLCRGSLAESRPRHTSDMRFPAFSRADDIRPAGPAEGRPPRAVEAATELNKLVSLPVFPREAFGGAASSEDLPLTRPHSSMKVPATNRAATAPSRIHTGSWSPWAVAVSVEGTSPRLSLLSACWCGSSPVDGRAVTWNSSMSLSSTPLDRGLCCDVRRW
mmetsp:Transcript_91829/g.249206  ORF Transcript_91829/g.249206 Transcript_91829/m.249206 type:complete len:348 (+) Transcript_91829:138-1181(+)